MAEEADIAEAPPARKPRAWPRRLVALLLGLIGAAMLVVIVLDSPIGHRFVVERIAVFDLYQGQGLPEGKKSLAFSLAFRAADRTLTDEEVNGVFTKIQDELVKDSGYQIRK